MPVVVGRHLDGGMAETGLHHLERQFEAAIDAAIDAPARVEMPERVQPGVFGSVTTRSHAGCDLHGL
jgi:hypothetical protein